MQLTIVAKIHGGLVSTQSTFASVLQSRDTYAARRSVTVDEFARYKYIVPLGRRCRDLSYLLGSPDASDNFFAFINATGRVRGTLGEIAIKEDR